MNSGIKKVGVIGIGLMGGGIARLRPQRVSYVGRRCHSGNCGPGHGTHPEQPASPGRELSKIEWQVGNRARGRGENCRAYQDFNGPA